jgi:hypothetical protein
MSVTDTGSLPDLCAGPARKEQGYYVGRVERNLLRPRLPSAPLMASQDDVMRGRRSRCRRVPGRRRLLAASPRPA